MVQLSIFSDSMTSYLRDFRHSTRKLLETTISAKGQLCFYTSITYWGTDHICIPIYNSTNNSKISLLNPTNEVKDIYNENFESLMESIKKDTPHLWIRIIMILSKSIYKLDAIQIKIPTRFFIEIEKKSWNLIQN